MLKAVHEESEAAENRTVGDSSVLDEIVRDGAWQMLAAALQVGVDEAGHRLVIRNGHHGGLEADRARGRGQGAGTEGQRQAHRRHEPGAEEILFGDPAGLVAYVAAGLPTPADSSRTPGPSPTPPAGREPVPRGALPPTHSRRTCWGRSSDVTDQAQPATAGRVMNIGVYRAWQFDLDGVLTKTAEVHAAAWKTTFDAVLGEEATRTGRPFDPFDPVADYERYVDGEPREDGVRNLLATRGITMPEGSDADPSRTRTIRAIGVRKNAQVQALLKATGVAVYESAIQFVKPPRGRGILTGRFRQREHRGSPGLHRWPGRQGAPSRRAARRGRYPGLNRLRRVKFARPARTIEEGSWDTKRTSRRR